VLQLRVFAEHKFVYRTSIPHPASRLRRGFGGLAAVLTAALLLAAHPSAQFEKTISTTYDGWRQLPDGSYDLVFGYMNRNTAEVELPLGPSNGVDPSPADRGQPTTFLPGRQRDVFRIHVPKEFKGKFVWSVSYAGTTQTATGSLDQNYSLDVGDPEPPAVTGGPDRTIRVGESVPLSPVVTGPPPPKERAADSGVVARQSRGNRVTVWWSKFRGPGSVTFGDGAATSASEGGPTGREFAMGSFRLTCTVPLTSTCGATTARFSEPGMYWLRVVAAERSAANALVKIRVEP
jgi:hypothetical protein